MREAARERKCLLIMTDCVKLIVIFIYKRSVKLMTDIIVLAVNAKWNRGVLQNVTSGPSRKSLWDRIRIEVHVAVQLY